MAIMSILNYCYLNFSINQQSSHYNNCHLQPRCPRLRSSPEPQKQATKISIQSGKCSGKKTITTAMDKCGKNRQVTDKYKRPFFWMRGTSNMALSDTFRILNKGTSNLWSVNGASEEKKLPRQFLIWDLSRATVRLVQHTRELQVVAW